MRGLSTRQSGYALMDVLLAMAIFSIGAIGFVLVLSQTFETARASGESLEANQILVESMEALKSIRNEDFNAFTDGLHGLDDSSGTWMLTDGPDTIGKYTRTITVASVYRDENDDMVEEGGTLDTRTKKINVEIAWNISPSREGSLTHTTYITKTDFSEWILTTAKDFMTGVFTQTVVEGIGDDGNIALDKQSEDYEWVLTSGASLIETTDEDFGDGEQILTVVEDVGDGAYITIDQTPGWNLASTDVGNELYSIEVFDPYTAWVVGAQGTILYFNGVTWSEIDSPVSNHVMGIDGIAPDDIWAVGKTGGIMHWDGVSWSLVDNPETNDHFAVKMIATDDVWIVGSSSNNLLHWNGTGWDTFSNPVNRTFNAIDGTATDAIWAVGNNGKIIYWDGSSWKNKPSPINGHLHAVHAVAPDDVWAVGDVGSIIHYDGTSWSEVTSPTSAHLLGIDGNAADNIWAVGSQGENLHWDGSTWNVLDAPSDRELNDVAMFSNGNVMTVGKSGRVHVWIESVQSGFYESSILMSENDWINFSWTEETPGNSYILVSYRTGNTTTPDDSWSDWSEEIADNTGGEIYSEDQYLQYRVGLKAADDETSPKLLDITFGLGGSSEESLYAIKQIDENFAIAVGDEGTALFFDGEEWTENSPTTSQQLHDIALLAHNEIYVVGDNGVLLKYTDAWSAQSIPTSQALFGIFAVSSSNIWAVGANGTILHYDGIAWNIASSPTESTLYRIHGTGADDIWAVGAGGVAIHYDGSSWTNVDTPTTATLYTVKSLTDGHVWAAGQGGTIVQYVVDSWGAYASPTTDTIHDLTFDTPGTGIAVGENGTLINYSGGVWTGLESPTTDSLYAVDQVTSNIGFAVGQTGRLIKPAGADYVYFSEGSYVSEIFDTGKDSAVWDYLYWTETIEPGTSLSIYTRSGNGPTIDETWSAWSPAYSTPSGEIITSPQARYIQIKTELQATDTSKTPALEEVIIMYD